METCEKLPPITAGIINFNGMEVIRGTIDSILSSGYPEEVEIIVVDDCSTDGSPEMIMESYPQVKVFLQQANSGPNAARNRVLKEAAHDTVFITDNDVELAPDCLEILASRVAMNPGASVATPMVLDFHDREMVYSNGAGLHYVCFGIISLRHQKIPEGLPLAPFRSVCGSGGIMMVRKEDALLVGGFDEDFIFGYDDGEFTYRISASGGLVEQAPAARIYHIEKPGRNPERLRFQIRGRWILILKAYSARSLVLLAPALLAFEMAQVAYLLMKGQAREWYYGVNMALSSLSAIRDKRRKVMELKATGDKDLLSDGEIFMFPSRVGGGFLLFAKSLMELGLSLYWKMAGPFLTK